MTTNAPAGGAAAPQGLSLPEKVIEHITLTDKALIKSAALEKQVTEKQAACDSMIPKVLDALVQNKRILPEQREKVGHMLKDPAQVLELMVKLAAHRNTEELERLGSGVSENGQHVKQAGYNPASSVTSPHVGARTTRIKQSDHALFRGLNLPVPVGQ